MPTYPELAAVLEAARAVLSARADGMLTSAEWDSLEAAAAACRPQPLNPHPWMAFRVEGGELLRAVVPRRGTPYEHACTEQVFKSVADAVERRGRTPFRVEDIRAELDAPYTQVNVAAQFLQERGCIERGRRRMLQAAANYTYEDALTEYHALKDCAPGSAAAVGKDEQA